MSGQYMRGACAWQHGKGTGKKLISSRARLDSPEARSVQQKGWWGRRLRSTCCLGSIRVVRGLVFGSGDEVEGGGNEWVALREPEFFPGIRGVQPEQ